MTPDMTPLKKKRHRRGKRGGRKQRERMLAVHGPSVRVIPPDTVPVLNPQAVAAMRQRLSLLTRKSA